MIFSLLFLFLVVHNSHSQFNQQNTTPQLPNQPFQQQQTQQSDGQLQQTIYQFLKSNARTTRFAQLVDQVSQMSTQSLLNILSSVDGPRVGSNGLTVFVPVNEALNTISNDLMTVKNDLENLVVTERLNVDRLRELNGQNISKTLGYKPKILIKTVKNFYLHNQNMPVKTSQKRQAVYPPVTSYTPPQTSSQYPQMYTSTNIFNPMQNNDSSAYDMYAQNNPNFGQQTSSNSPISSKLPYDEIFLLNNAIVLDIFELTNGIVYLINAYPRFYDKSLLVLLTENDINGLGQNLNYWISRASQSFRLGDENLKNALSAYDQTHV